MKAMLQRDWLLFRRGLIPALILTLLLGLASGLAAYSVTQSAGERSAPVKVGLVDEEGGLLSRMAVNLISSQDFISHLMELEPTRRDNALRGLDSGRYGAVIILPKGYIDQVRYGTAGRGQIILSKAAAASSEVVSSLARFGELLLSAGQNTIFAGERIVAERGLSPEFHNYFLDKVNGDLLDQAFRIYEKGVLKEMAPYIGTGLSTAAYYGAAWISFFLLICGLFFPALYTQDVKKSVLTRLYSLSVTPERFLMGKLLYPFAFRLPILAALLLILNAYLPLQGGFLSFILAFLSLLMSTLLISGCSLALGQKKGWQGLLIALTAAGLFLSGGLIPRSMLPDWILTLGRFTPFGAVFSGLTPLWGGGIDILSLLSGLIFCLLSLMWARQHLKAIPQKGEE